MLINRSPVLTAGVAALCAVLLAGCGSATDGPQRYRLSGKVTFNGQPVPAGQIIFEPDTSAGNSGPQGYAEIVDGAYRTDDKGPVGGPQRIRISGYEGVSSDENHPATTLFSDYQTTADLPKANSELDFDVPATAAPKP